MKNLLVIACLAFLFSAKASNTSLLAVKPTTLVTKTDRGLFGYKDVDDGTTPNGNYWLSCAHPGFKKCTPSAFVIPGGDVGVEFLNTIDRMVSERISETNTKGVFLYQNYTIKYKYVEGNGKLTYKIYDNEDFTGAVANEEL